MALINTRSDALRMMRSALFHVGFMRPVGTIHGVAPQQAAGMCGKGIAAIASHNDGKDLSFRAPGSSIFGPRVRCENDDVYLLEDGEDSNKWLKVDVRTAFLLPTPQQARVFLKYSDSEMVSEQNIPTAPTGLSLAIENMSDKTVENIRVWSPTPNTTFNLGSGDTAAASEAVALDAGSLGVGASRDLGMKLSVPGGSSTAAEELVEVYAKWDSF